MKVFNDSSCVRKVLSIYFNGLRYQCLIKTLHAFIIAIRIVAGSFKTRQQTQRKKWIALRYSIHSKCHKLFLCHCCDPCRIKNVIKSTKFPHTFLSALHDTEQHQNIRNCEIGKRQLFLTWISFLCDFLCDGFLWFFRRIICNSF